ncbi:MAG: TetR/AcrR family transcriptional regulator [Catenulispora sp.]|nr:TetR/AcrR family transcriptional regulator [Catenulispora sp.]
MDPETLWSDRRPQRGRPPAHTRDAVVAKAVGVADAEGLSAVTMRRVATALGTGTMSLYTYVSERDALLELMVDAVIGEQQLPPASGDWRADLAAFAHGQRALMRRHPWLPVALTGRRTLGPNTLRALDHALALLAPAGLAPQARLEAFALISGFVASHVGYELAQEQAFGPGDADDAKEFAESHARHLAKAVESGAYPHFAEAMTLASADGTIAAPDPDATFERLLARIINGLTEKAAPPARVPTAKG